MASQTYGQGVGGDGEVNILKLYDRVMYSTVDSMSAWVLQG